jgi:hypothetical protein
MPVPKTAMHENNSLSPRQDDVGRSGQIPLMYPEPVSHPVEQGTNRDLRLRIPALDPGH